jgi:hypothetical protein
MNLTLHCLTKFIAACGISKVAIERESLSELSVCSHVIEQITRAGEADERSFIPLSTRVAL